MAKWFSIENNVNEASGEASVFVNGDIGFFGVTADQFIADVKALNVTKLNVRINSGGGEVFEALAIANFLRNTNIEVHTFIESMAGSAATLIALAGQTVNISPNAFFFIHNPSAMAGGESSDLRDVANDMDKIRDSLVNTYVAKTGLARVQIEDMMDAETLLTAQEALGLRFVDNILSESSGKIAAHVTKWGQNGNNLQNKIKLKMDNTELNNKVSNVENMLTKFINSFKPAADEKTPKEVKISDQTEIMNQFDELKNDLTTRISENEALKTKNEALEADLATANESLAAAQEDAARGEVDKTETEENEDKELTDDVTVVNSLEASLTQKLKNRYSTK